jgi:DNA-binding IclR family transcriptional regulator
VKPKPSGTVRKAFQVLDQLSGSQAEPAPREVAQLTGLDRTTDIESRLEQIRIIGYDTSDREVFPDLVAIAVPVVGRSGSALASIGLSAPANSTTVEKLTERVLSQTHRRSPAYGYGAPPPRLTLWISVQ